MFRFDLFIYFLFVCAEVIEQDARHVFEDVLDEFATVRGILQQFESWRRQDLDAYVEAYVSICLPKLLGPILRLKLLFWNPISQVSYFLILMISCILIYENLISRNLNFHFYRVFALKV